MPHSDKLSTLLSREPAEADVMPKQTTITIETRSLLVFQSRASRQTWCPICRARVTMILFEDGGLLAELAPMLAHWLSSGEVHQVESVDGSALVCLNSLLARAQKQQPG
jgi:hypothetical protein